MTTDAFADFKDAQRKSWALFTPLETVTGTVAPDLVSFAGIERGHKVLDVGCGTGVAALTAARRGARVTGVDLTPTLIERAKENSQIAKVEVDWHIGDAEQLSFPDATFDVVMSQFGHMFAPQADVAVRQMLRVLKPGGTIAFSTWPPDLYTGRMFALVGRYLPAPPPGVTPPPQWGDPKFVRERLGSGVKDIAFTQGTMRFPALSAQHVRHNLEQAVGPVIRVVDLLQNDSTKLATFRSELEELIAIYFENNTLRQDFLITRARKT